MLWQKHQNSPQWAQTDDIIDSWLKERQELLVRYYAICHLEPFDSEEMEADTYKLQAFCEILVDYVSAGHFEVFERLAHIASSSHSTDPSWYRNLLVEILKTTLLALDFNDKYADNEPKYGIKAELSRLGEHLSTRMDLEDQLITAYLQTS